MIEQCVKGDSAVFTSNGKVIVLQYTVTEMQTEE